MFLKVVQIVTVIILLRLSHCVEHCMYVCKSVDKPWKFWKLAYINNNVGHVKKELYML